MVWKDTKKYTEEDKKHISKRLVKVKNNPIFSKGHTRKSADIKNHENYKISTEKKLTREQKLIYDQAMEKVRKKKEYKSK